MFTLDFVTENNRKEAIEILRKNGGRINFASALDNGIDDFDFNNSNIDVNDDLPGVILDCGCGPFDAHVLAARIADDSIDILTYDPVENHIEWVATAACCSYSENDVYLTIDNYNK